MSSQPMMGLSSNTGSDVQILFDITTPIFLIIGAGALATRARLFTADACDGVMVYAQQFAIPCLLFMAIGRMDLTMEVNPSLLASFYGGSAFCFIAGITGARLLFHRSWEDAVVIGFCALFGNTVLLGLAVVGRAYSDAALSATFTIVAFHALFCYTIGVATFELRRDRRDASGRVVRQILRSLASNALLIGLVLGLAFNLLGITLPHVIADALGFLASGGIPAALFALGGVLTRYRIEGDTGPIAMVCLLSLLVHPALTLMLSTLVFDLDDDLVRSAVVTAAMAPGINAFLFASIYQRAMRISASAILIGTLLSLFTASFWIAVLP